MSVPLEKGPQVSVLVPSYNHAPFIERCLKSITKQTTPPSELLVIDDGSKDDSVRVIERVLNDCPLRCELIARANKGLCATLNEGLEKTKGDYFAYLGSDDVWLPQFLEERSRLLSRRPNSLLAYGHSYLIDESDRIIDSSENWTYSSYLDGDVREMLRSGFSPVSPTVFYRRSALETIRWNDSARLEDYEIYLQLAELGDFAFDPQILSGWRMHSYNTSRNCLWLLNEVLEAQSRVGRMMHWEEEKLRAMKTAASFRFSEDLARKGHKLLALSLLMRNLRGAPSLSRVGDVVLRLLIPRRLLDLRRRHVQNDFAERHGVLQI